MENYIITDIRREFLIQALKQSIRVRFHPVLAEFYCRQVDEAKHFAKLLEAIQKSQ